MTSDEVKVIKELALSIEKKDSTISNLRALVAVLLVVVFLFASILFSYSPHITIKDGEIRNLTATNNTAVLTHSVKITPLMAEKCWYRIYYIP